MAEERPSDPPQRAQPGEPRTLEALLQRHYLEILTFARTRMSKSLRAHETPDDLVQSTCRDLLAHGERFDYRGEGAFRTWLLKAVLHKVLNHERRLRAKRRDVRREVPLPSSTVMQLFADGVSPTGQLLTAERLRQLESALAELPWHYREVITLSRLQRLDRASVAARMGRSEGSVRNLLSRALVALAKLLDQDQTTTSHG